MTNAILITGKTYPHRRELRSAGAIFDYNEKGYIVSADNLAAKKIAENAGLCVEEYQANEDQLMPATGERLREVRQAKIERKRVSLLNRADAADRRADEAWNRLSSSEKDFLSLAEPIKVGHHSERRHRRLIARSQKAADDACNEYVKAVELRERANNLRNAQVKGDAERQRAIKIAEADAIISVGDLVHCYLASGNQAIVVRKNKKTFTVRSEGSGDTFPVMKHFCSLLEKREPVKINRKFKKGDAVIYTLGASEFKAVVKRCTPNGYTIEYSYTVRGFDMERKRVVRKRTVDESALTKCI